MIGAEQQQVSTCLLEAVLSCSQLSKHIVLAVFQVVLLAFSEHGEVDAAGQLLLATLREFGLPTLVPVVKTLPNAPLKVRAASKKLAAASLELQVSPFSLQGHEISPRGALQET